MKYCETCDKEFDTEDKLCPDCGAALEITEGSCSDATLAASMFNIGMM